VHGRWFGCIGVQNQICFEGRRGFGVLPCAHGMGVLGCGGHGEETERLSFLILVFRGLVCTVEANSNKMQRRGRCRETIDLD
jgi:hypothetical protein